PLAWWARVTSAARRGGDWASASCSAVGVALLGAIMTAARAPTPSTSWAETLWIMALPRVWLRWGSLRFRRAPAAMASQTTTIAKAIWVHRMWVTPGDGSGAWLRWR